MAASSEDNFVMEARKEEMTSPLMNRQSSRRTAHFLRPSVTSIDGHVFEPPLDSVKPTICTTQVPLESYFTWWRHPNREWEKWVYRMAALHHSTWNKAGIYDAIMNSTFNIHHNDNLIIGFAEKWCPKTNTFVFPWGEATITLEDVMIIGGFSVLGESVKTPLGDEGEMILQQMVDEPSSFMVGKVTKVKKPSQEAWMRKFMDNGSKIEHQAFLAYWLSRYVFPYGLSQGSDLILETIFPITVHLARGTRIALAPAVLASIYKNLRSLKEAMAVTRNLEARGESASLKVEIRAPFQLVQVWAWERFPSLRPKPNRVTCGQPRFAQWHGLQKPGLEKIFSMLDRAEEEFIWRPYMTPLNNFLPAMVYKDEVQWISVNSGLGDKCDELARCLRTSELVNHEVDCIEQYLPHRVAMQFGMDQDLPGCVARVNGSFDIAWKNYTREVRDLVMYVPARSFSSGVTTRYMKWWRKLKLAGSGTIEACKGKNTTSSGSKSIELEGLIKSKLVDNFCFPPMVNCMSKGVSGTKDKETVDENFHVEGNGISSSLGTKDKEKVVENYRVEGDGISSSSAHKEADFLGNGSQSIEMEDDFGIPLMVNCMSRGVSVTKDKETMDENFQVEGNGISSSSCTKDKEKVVENFQVEGDGISSSSAHKESDFLGNGSQSIEMEDDFGFPPMVNCMSTGVSFTKDKETVDEYFQVEGDGISSAHNDFVFLEHGISEMSKRKPLESFSGTKSIKDAVIPLPPGSSPKRARVEVDNSGLKDKETRAELLEGESSDNISKILEQPGMMTLEERICGIENIYAWLKAGNHRIDY